MVNFNSADVQGVDMVRIEKRRPVGVDLFAGAGGMALGFEQAGFDVLASIETDPIHCAIHEFNFPFWSILCENIVDTTAKKIRNFSFVGDKEIDVVFGGPPCQGFSMIGKRLVDDPRNHLIFQFLRIVLELNPKFFVMENVRGITIGKNKEILNDLISLFQFNGYKVEENYRVLNAANYGVPQYRERLFLIGCREDCELPTYPPPITKKPELKNSAYSNLSHLPVGSTVWDAIGDIPEAENYPELLNRDWVVAEYGKPSNYSGQLRGLYTLEDDYSYEREYDPQILSSSLRTEHSLESRQRFAATPQGKMEPISRFHKLHPEGVSCTLRAGTDQHRGAFTSPRPIHPFTPRCITVREAARLHSYPDWFRFHMTKWHGFRQVGNSVPPLLAKAVATEIIRALGVLPFKPTLRQELADEKLLKFNMLQAARYYRVEPLKNM
jgi:DNA (cytosine-5)-methyltransferase 1